MMYLIIIFVSGVVWGTVEFFRENLPLGKPPNPEPLRDYETEEKRAFLEGQLRDLKRLHSLDELALERAETLGQQRAMMSRIIALDKKIFDIQQKLYKL